MPHISEGDLHAWLDGAIPEDSGVHQAMRLHLESCSDCASRMEEARELRNDAGDILSAALPRGSAPGFEDIRSRAEHGEADPPTAASDRSRLRRGWLSAQRLGWAATVMLAVGAGWIGRAVLVEKGWTDPFNEGEPSLASQVAETESPEDAPRESFGDEFVALEEKDEAGERRDQLARSNEVPRKGDAEGLAEDNASLDPKEQSKVAISPPDADAAQDQEAVARRRTGALAQAEEPQAEDLAVVDGVMPAPAGGVRQEARSKTVQPALDPWHAIPAFRLAPPAATAPGCYRLEYSWSPGVAYMPGAIELTVMEPDGLTGQSIYAVTTLGGIGSRLHEAIWASPAPDSIWVRLVSGEDRDAFTVRAGQSGSDWLGEGRVLTPGSPVSAGQTRGTVHLVAIRCEPA